MEFNIGKHCSLQECKQLDFLPFECDACKKIFCLEHRTSEAHKCPNQNRDIEENKVNTQDISKSKHSYSCQKSGCKGHELIEIRCISCRLRFCVKHRLEQDHSCKGLQKGQSRLLTPKNSITTNNPTIGTGSQSSKTATVTKPKIQVSPNTTILIRLTNGDVMRQVFETSATLSIVHQFIDENRTDGDCEYTMRTTFPVHIFSEQDDNKTLQQLQLVPSGTIILKATQKISITDNVPPAQQPQEEPSFVQSLLSYLNPFG